MKWALPMHDWQDVEQGEGWLTSITGWRYPGFWFRSSLPFLCYERALLSFLAGILGMVGTESRNRVSHGNYSTILPNLMGSQASSFQALHRTLFLPLGILIDKILFYQLYQWLHVSIMFLQFTVQEKCFHCAWNFKCAGSGCAFQGQSKAWMLYLSEWVERFSRIFSFTCTILMQSKTEEETRVASKYASLVPGEPSAVHRWPQERIGTSGNKKERHMLVTVWFICSATLVLHTQFLCFLMLCDT